MKKKIRIGICTFTVIIAMGLCGCTDIKKEGGSIVEEINVNQRSYTEIAAILEKYGINGITDTLTSNLEDAYMQLPEDVIFDKTATLLASVGAGETNYDTWEWTPSENGVYSFDVEIFNLEMMYTNFLLGISAIGEGELDFKNVIEDTSGLDWENGTGKRTVSFEWNGYTYTLEAQADNDWFDINVAYELNKIIISNGSGKQLYFTGDGYQECIIFYRDAKWADAFQRETGLDLSEQ